jgi:hypothetical protein
MICIDCGFHCDRINADRHHASESVFDLANPLIKGEIPGSMAVCMKMTVFWDVVPGSLVEVCSLFNLYPPNGMSVPATVPVFGRAVQRLYHCVIPL